MTELFVKKDGDDLSQTKEKRDQINDLMGDMNIQVCFDFFKKLALDNQHAKESRTRSFKTMKSWRSIEQFQVELYKKASTTP